jgi:imidazolonepropionase-like amidohydrolase
MTFSTHHQRKTLYRCGFVQLATLAVVAIAMVSQPVRAGGGTIVVKGVTIHVGNGEVIDNGVVVIRDGRIAQVGANLAIPPGAKVIELSGGSLTPGLIDANAALEPTNRMMVDRRNARQVVADLFHGDHKDHKHEAVGCCGSKCSRQLQHASGEKCKQCGFPDTLPMAVGVRRSAMTVEHSSEVIPQTHVIDSVNLRSPDFDRLVGGGVTTVFVAPDSAAVISSQGAIVRTAGPLNARIVRETDAVMAAMGTDPSWRGFGNRQPFRQFVNFYSRRPTTRMGVAWVFRKAMYDTERFEKGAVVYGADAPTEPAMKELRHVLSGEIPLRIQARMQHDILAAHRLADEFGLKFTLIEATEAHRCLDELKKAKTPVVYGPVYIDAPGMRRYSSEVDHARLHTLKELLRAGIPTALTANELRDEDGLARQAMYARRFGVSLADVTRCVTETPAKLLGIADEVGTVTSGKRADLVLWNGEPFDGSSKPIVVIAGGEIVVDRRKG